MKILWQNLHQYTNNQVLGAVICTSSSLPALLTHVPSWPALFRTDRKEETGVWEEKRRQSTQKSCGVNFQCELESNPRGRVNPVLKTVLLFRCAALCVGSGGPRGSFSTSSRPRKKMPLTLHYLPQRKTMTQASHWNGWRGKS